MDEEGKGWGFRVLGFWGRDSGCKRVKKGLCRGGWGLEVGYIGVLGTL